MPSSSVSSAPVIGRIPSGLQRLRHLHGAVQPVVVGQREGAVALLGRRRRPARPDATPRRGTNRRSGNAARRTARTYVRIPFKRLKGSDPCRLATLRRRFACVEHRVGAGDQAVRALARLVRGHAEARLRSGRIGSRAATETACCSRCTHPLGVELARAREHDRELVAAEPVGVVAAQPGARARPRAAAARGRRPRGRACRSRASGCPCRTGSARTPRPARATSRASRAAEGAPVEQRR